MRNFTLQLDTTELFNLTCACSCTQCADVHVSSSTMPGRCKVNMQVANAFVGFQHAKIFDRLKL